MNQQQLDFEKQDRIQAAKDLVRIADQMEQTEPSDPFYKTLNREYKIAMERAGITKNGKAASAKETEIKADKVQKSREECLKKIISALDNYEAWEAEIKKLYIGEMGHIAFSYLNNYNGFPHEIQLLIPDAFYRSYSGYQATKTRVSLVSQKQLKGYPNWQYALISFGIELCSKKERKPFFEKYAVPHNKKINDEKNKTAS